MGMNGDGRMLVDKRGRMDEIRPMESDKQMDVDGCWMEINEHRT